MMSDSDFRVIADSNNVPGIVMEKDGVHFGCRAAAVPGERDGGRTVHDEGTVSAGEIRV